MNGPSNFATAIAATRTDRIGNGIYPLRRPGRWHSSPAAARSRKRVGSLQNWRLRRVIEFVEANMQRPLALADLARTAGLSRMHFAAQFREATGLRPHEYVLRRRIERAKEMLAASAAPIAEVALHVGFSSQGHFTVVFKRFTGMSPYRWRCTLANRDDCSPVCRLSHGHALADRLNY